MGRQRHCRFQFITAYFTVRFQIIKEQLIFLNVSGPRSGKSHDSEKCFLARSSALPITLYSPAGENYDHVEAEQAIHGA